MTEDAARDVQNEIGCDSAMIAVLDVCDDVKVKHSMQEAVSRWGKINVAINCAGIAPPMRTLSRKVTFRQIYAFDQANVLSNSACIFLVCCLW
jgi:3-hydroxyacyl-CoA dehydrogenase/3-hydroxy-2-methylbutyryl-CoA dehydrogenase